MKPPAFDYARPESLDEALALQARHGAEAKVIAGGQSLMPLLNFRMLRPGILVDINRIDALAQVAPGPSGLRIGALTRHRLLETAPVIRERFPVVAAAMQHVAHLAIRNRGTIGGSLAHADPAAELPMLALLLDAEIEVRAQAGARTVAAADFFLGPLTTALQEDEIITAVVAPDLPAGAGWAFEEFSQRTGDFAIAAVAAIVALRDGVVAEARLAAMGVDETPVRLREIEAEIAGATGTPELMAHAAARASESVNPSTDLKASADYRRHLVRALTKRALAAAVARAEAHA